MKISEIEVDGITKLLNQVEIGEDGITTDLLNQGPDILDLLKDDWEMKQVLYVNTGKGRIHTEILNKKDTSLFTGITPEGFIELEPQAGLCVNSTVSSDFIKQKLKEFGEYGVSYISNKKGYTDTIICIQQHSVDGLW